MSLRPRNNLLGSSVFKLTLVASLACLVAAITIMWALYWVNIWQTHDEMRGQLEERWFELEALFEEDGLGALTEELTIDDARIWDPDILYEALEEGFPVARLINQADETVAGLELMDPPGGFSRSFLEFESLDGDPALFLRYELGGEYELVVARFFPEHLGYYRELLGMGMWLLALVILPMALFTAWWLSRSVFGRLSEISETAETIGEGTLDNRIPLKGNEDEFDRLASAVNDMLGRVSALTRNIENVSVGVAHDLKTPVSNIAGRLQLIERDAKDPSAVQTHVAAAHMHIETLLGTLNALLRLGEVEAGKRKSAFQTVDLSGLIQEFAESFVPVIEDADKHLSMDLSDSLTVTGDPDLLIQMLSNLLENFVEHGRDGGKARLALGRIGDQAILRISDDGPGIPEHRRDQIFERFFRLDASRSVEGNGLGLSLVKSIAELHDGNCQLVAGEPGAVFEIRLPLTN
ncbi:MAG: ATP-binding protein [Pseudomonadota bacterium]